MVRAPIYLPPSVCWQIFLWKRPSGIGKRWPDFFIFCHRGEAGFAKCRFQFANQFYCGGVHRLFGRLCHIANAHDLDIQFGGHLLSALITGLFYPILAWPLSVILSSLQEGL